MKIKYTRHHTMVLLPLLILLSAQLCHGGSYKLPNGDYWEYFGHDKPEVCNMGKAQSPIMLSQRNSVNDSVGSYHLTSYRAPLQLEVKNNGHTAEFSLQNNTASVPTISRGPLLGLYALAQFHFHWGVNNSIGSEHTFDGRHFPLELQLVHYKKEYGGSISEAVQKAGKGDNLAVLGVLFEIAEDDNASLQPMLNSSKNIKDEKSSANVTAPFPPIDLLPNNKNGMFVYDGSLTTPGCNEIVIWNVFESVNTISSRQMQQFRSLMSHGSHLVNNYRDIQPRNSRKIRLLH
uniref:carbonic anhydrase n=1 Tax=Caligus clemensi TaxID=344056 RepID=C1C1H8_CALCM|nr:Carbonic anhydrase 2 [Caligus clemensi]